ncbi:uncharacterized protein K02A2.6-like [Pseudomyrmex gracilis]|uniref:uncharacterized protein K02A2.6-like n=1 Tax=Pseudomyrmex gracilis TaxID=219809 RepID=UPI0009954A40|nr:uncharacterized protein K02A2.6-like [Pseudomyrmex gracilis]
MTSTEQRYPQIDKEALAIVWAVQKFFHYLYARHFTLITDHKPLVQILHPTRSLPVLCISRMANYADYLAHFNYDVVFRPTKAHTNADYCSRLPSLPTTSAVHSLTIEKQPETIDDVLTSFVLCQVNQLPVRATHVARETKKDVELGKLVRLLEEGRDLGRYGYKAPEANYTLVSGCLMFEHRVVIPPSLQQAILCDLHSAHVGIVKMKGIARSFVYWPGIDRAIEQSVKSCGECAKHASTPTRFLDHHWEYPKGPWERVHVDYAGPVAGSMLLVVVDAYSKWLEVKPTKSTTTQATVQLLDELFSTYGSPVTIVSDNGTQFTAGEFSQFLKQSGVKYHKRTAPYHPSTNGQAERYVQTVKNALSAMGTTPASLQENLNKFLRQYRQAPHATTGQSPVRLFLGRSLRTRLDLVRSEEVGVRIMEKQRAEFEPLFRKFRVNQAVYFLSGNPRMDKWVPGRVVTRLGDLHYEIDYGGRRFKRHVDQMRDRVEGKVPEQPTATGQPSGGLGATESPRRVHFYGNSALEVTGTEVRPEAAPLMTRTESSSAVADSTRRAHASPCHQGPTASGALRRTTRVRRPPQRYTPA